MFTRVLLVYTISVTCFSAVVTISPACADQCQCHMGAITCSNGIPRMLPPNISYVLMQSVDFFVYSQKHPFKDHSWKSIDSLVILPDKDVQEAALITRVMFSIRKGLFENLVSLRHLTFSSINLNYIEDGAFIGLGSLETLDLNDCPRLHPDDIVRGMEGATLSNLTALHLRQLSKLNVDAASFTDGFFRAIEDKPIMVLDLSQVDSRYLSMEMFSKSLPKLEKLNIERGGILLYYVLKAMALHPDSFSNMRELNGNYPEWRSYVFDFLNSLALDILIKPKVFKNLKVWNARGVVPQSEEVEIHPFISEDRICPRVVFRGTKMVWDLPLCSKQNLESENDLFHFEHLDLGDNGITYIDPKFSYLLANVVSLDFSKNKLGDKINELFSSLQMPFESGWISKLKKLDLSDNGMSYLSRPFDISGIAEIKVFNLSYNRLETMPSFIGELHHLEMLDLSFNKIHFLEDSGAEINRFFVYLDADNLTEQADDLSVNYLVLNFTGNPFLCDCAHKHDIEWLLNHKTQLTGDILECHYKGSTLLIDEQVMPKIEDLCLYPIIVAIVSITSVVVVVIICVVAIVYLQRRRRNMKERRFKALIDEYKNDPNRKELPVFLSFSSRDKEIAHQYIKPRLNQGLQKLLETDETCVATGDLNFLPGFTITGEMIRCIESAKVVVFCVSESFCASEYCREEVMIADCTRTPAILLFLEEVNEKNMSKILQIYYKTSARCKIVVNEGKRYLYPHWNVLCRSVIELFANDE